MKPVFYSHPACRRHDMGAGHPECPARLEAIEESLRLSGMDVALDWRQAPPATAAQLGRAHSAEYVARMLALLQQVQDEGVARRIDPDTVASPATLAAALHAAGAAVAAVDAVMGGALGAPDASGTPGSPKTAFCAVRPPGHHATREQAMGFCFFNNVAVAAHHALAVHGLQRVAIVDFDVHHGNGTEDIIAGDQRVLMVSFFQHPLYPFCGDEPKGRNMVNVPLAPYSRGPQAREAVLQQWLPALDAFKPQMLFISAGFDAHRDDELGQLGLVEADYQWITQQLVAVAQRHAQGRIVSCLEGGYHLGALARSVLVHLRVLADLA
jgi:acetoin utilization deacetylase AcuC-like enzyme